jgi:hypothetical protein
MERAKAQQVTAPPFKGNKLAYHVFYTGFIVNTLYGSLVYHSF